MATNAEQAYELLKAAIGQPEGTGDWFEIDQERINQFADVTERPPVHPRRPGAGQELSPWGAPIAHGFLTLSMLTTSRARCRQRRRAATRAS